MSGHRVATRRAGGLTLRVEVGGSTVASLRVEEPGWDLLEAALTTVWAVEPTRLADCLERREDWLWEGAVGFHYPDGDPSIPADRVAVRGDGEEKLMRREDFEAVAAAFGLAALEGLRALERPVPYGLDERLRRFSR